jgi:phosphatidylserine/phosphatidylglycerophosphate/cardiolipin synthase-like enzyme
MQSRIVSPGRNCWRLAHARAAAVLIDGAEYFARLESALRQARHSILILGWDFDGRIRLCADAEPARSPQLGPWLRSLVEARPELRIRILVWSTAVLHAPSAPGPLLVGADWQNHPRLRVKLDTRHPIYAAHHQKVVVIDDRIAFVGGMDLTVHRWDTSRHKADDRHRRGPDGIPYAPVHDVQMLVDGEAARSIAELARERWRVATSEDIGGVEARHEPWPAGLEPQFRDTLVAIARTMPAREGRPAIHEAAALTLDALAGAKRSIYIETQYMTASFIGDVLVRHLEAPLGPEVVIITTHDSRGLVERLVMGGNRDRLIRRLRQADRHDRLRVYYPVVAGAQGEDQILVHSKLIIVDDGLLRVGSSNLNNRSAGLDTECDLAIEARNERERRAIRGIRDRLVAEHVGVDTGAVASSGGSLIATIERFNDGPKALRPFAAMTQRGPTRPVFGTGLLDPQRPFEPLWLLRRKRRTRP